jgi:uncharacterized membrane protein
MSKQTRWLFTQLDRWTQDNVISPGQAAQIRALYPETTVPWGLIVFSSAGAAILGLGVILLFAYNWNDIPRLGKLALVLSALAATHAGGLHWYRQSDWRQKLGEALCLLGSMLFGAGIWLVAQAYHIDEHFPNGFLFWALGALAMAWALNSIAQGLLATVLIAIWGCTEALEFSQPMQIALGLIIVGIGPLIWRQKSALLLAAAIVSFDLILVSSCGSQAFTALFSFSALAIAGARLVSSEKPAFARGASVAVFLGFAGYLVCVYLLSFSHLSDDLLNWHRYQAARISVAVSTYGLFIAAILGWGILLVRACRKTAAIAVEEWLCPIGVIYAFGLAAAGAYEESVFVAVVFNLVFLGIAMMWMWRGCRDALWRPTVLGSLMLAALLFARYFDLFESLAARGLVFLVLGACFLGEALFYRKNRAMESSSGGQP